MKLLLMILVLHLITVGAAPPAAAEDEVWAYQCEESDDLFSSSAYKSNLDSLLAKITTLNTASGFYNLTAGQDADQVFLKAQCRGDVAVSECHACLSSLKANITGVCPTNKLVRMWAEKCTLYYSYKEIRGEWESSPMESKFTGISVGGNVDHFSQVLEGLLMSLPNKTAEGNDKGITFATGEASVNASLKIYSLMQCTLDLIPTRCLGCLYWNMYYVLFSDPRGQTAVWVATTGCSVRYELAKFYNASSSGSGNGVNPKVVIISVLSVSLVLVLILFGILICLVLTRRQKDKMREKAIHFKSVEMDFKTIKRATWNFSKPLGRTGGKSRVYRGKLDGDAIAVKRIKATSTSNDKEFKNAILTTTKLQHINLADVIGYCVEADERLIIFEFVSKGSLDQILFDPKYAKERAQLDWTKRYKIIQGIAKGLEYLHGIYRYHNLHRDLKAANVLLDDKWTPKITDIGTTKLFQEDKPKTHLDAQAEAAVVLIPQNQAQETTQQKGTTAYMAPEYLIDGISSDKSDVYSFGVLVLEIIAGRPRSVIPDQEDMIAMARRTFNQGTVLEFIDPKIRPTTLDSAGSQMKDCIEIALGCLHENAEQRVGMASVVEMLTQLEQQPFTPEHLPHSSPIPLLPNRYQSSSSP